MEGCISKITITQVKTTLIMLLIIKTRCFLLVEQNLLIPLGDRANFPTKLCLRITLLETTMAISIWWDSLSSSPVGPLCSNSSNHCNSQLITSIPRPIPSSPYPHYLAKQPSLPTKIRKISSSSIRHYIKVKSQFDCEPKTAKISLSIWISR